VSEVTQVVESLREALNQMEEALELVELAEKMALAASVLMVLAGTIRAQTLTDLGATAPTPGANDVSQLSTSGNTTAPDGLNYYTDNQ
jgi:hypothetical protein